MPWNPQWCTTPVWICQPMRRTSIGMEQEYAGRIRPMFGVEVGLMDTNLERTRAYVKGYQFQQVLASLHILENQPNFHKPEAWEGKTKGMSSGCIWRPWSV